MTTSKQTPLGTNIVSTNLQEIGFNINPVAASYMGESKNNDLYTFGKLIQNTCLRVLTWAINDAYVRSAYAALSEWHTVTNGSWGSFMNSYAVWSGPNTEITTRNAYATVNFPSTGMYTFTMAADNHMNVVIDYDTPIAVGIKNFTTFETVTTRISAGNHVISMIITNDASGGPAGGALTIAGNGLSWNSTSVVRSPTEGATVNNLNYDSLLTIGSGVIPALGNSPPYTWTNYDPSSRWYGPATTGYYLMEDYGPAEGQAQTALWRAFNLANLNKSITQWGYYRCFPLQAWNEFNYNGEPTGSTSLYTTGQSMPQYKEFISSFLSAFSFVNYANPGIKSFQEAPEYLKGIYSNMDDLISSDITGISLATKVFGQDCITLGRVINLDKIEAFGLPSILLQTIRQNKILTDALSLALLSTGLTPTEINDIASGNIESVTKTQEQKIYSAFLIIVGQDLNDILFALNCKTLGLESLADLLNIKKIFPNSYQSLTVPIYNSQPGPTNSKTYYPIYDGNGVSDRIQSTQVASQVGETILSGTPPVIEPITSTDSVIQTLETTMPVNRSGGMLRNIEENMVLK